MSPHHRSRPAPGTVDLRQAAWTALLKLAPREAARNPVMFVVWVGTLVCAVAAIGGWHPGQGNGFALAVSVILLATVWFANLAEAIAEARARGQAASLKATRAELFGLRLRSDGSSERVAAQQLRRGDRVRVSAGELVPADGEIIEGLATINEAAVTGESAPVLREAGTDHSGVVAGTRVLTDQFVMEVGAEPGDSFLDRMIRLVEGARRQKTPNELAMTVVLAAMTLVFLVVVVTLPTIAAFVGVDLGVVVLIALLVCLIPTTIGGLLPAIGIAGMNRALAANVVAKSGKAIEVAGDVDLLLIDKTGTITLGDRRATDFLPLAGVPSETLRHAALLSSLADPTPEGKSIVQLAEQQGSLRPSVPAAAVFHAFSAATRMSGVDLPEQPRIRKGAGEAILRWATQAGAAAPADLKPLIERVARGGATPLVVASEQRILGVVALSDVLKPDVRERFARLRQAGVRSVMITGDNPLTAAAIAAAAGVDDFIAEATPEDKLAAIRAAQAEGRLVAMVGDGTNDAPALAQADIGLAMNSGTQAAKEAGNVVDLDSDPSKLIDVVEIGKQMLITRGALTTFSLANDVAKYFVILPALFAAAFPALAALDVLKLHSPQSAVLAALVFNALVIPALIPLALRGVRYRPDNATALLRRNLLIYGLGGLLVPFPAIKLLDLLIAPLLGA
ncbi:MAG: potassium-transporting ATPase subunit KdpB [Lysobacterales bacterium]